MNKDLNYFWSDQYMQQFVATHKPINQEKIKTNHNQTIFFAEYGNPQGKPIVVLHGGPGGSSNPIDLAFFDLNKYRIILYDQRHCGLSKVTEDWTQFNTTQDLINDLEVLRKHLNITKWSIFAGSWGSCLGLCYAIQRPEIVETQIYWGILLGRKSCIDFIDPKLLSPMEYFYCQYNFFIPENYILDNIHILKNHPIKIVHGSADIICSVSNAYELAKNIDNVKLVIAKGESHNPFMPEMFKALSSFTKEI